MPANLHDLRYRNATGVATAYKCHLWLDWMKEIAVTIASIFAELDAHRQMNIEEFSWKQVVAEFEPAYLSAQHA
ncbi:hypothetical protein AVEN_990-1 [Araneus ventricosus]|uniref:Uncharacterized protein n=1 Tax=Araneus ventricosus TaxID=182803 RepID=A0A4Y2CYI0_ARAVE|nr:hypothetical protein AVEN_990-1 [Araneus ventricosus]